MKVNAFRRCVPRFNRKRVNIELLRGGKEGDLKRRKPRGDTPSQVGYTKRAPKSKVYNAFMGPVWIYFRALLFICIAVWWVIDYSMFLRCMYWMSAFMVVKTWYNPSMKFYARNISNKKQPAASAMYVWAITFI